MRLNRMQHLPFLHLSFLLLPNWGNPPPVTSVRDDSVAAMCPLVRKMMAKEVYTSTGDTKASVPSVLLVVEEDREE